MTADLILTAVLLLALAVAVSYAILFAWLSVLSARVSEQSRRLDEIATSLASERNRRIEAAVAFAALTLRVDKARGDIHKLETLADELTVQFDQLGRNI